MALPFKVSTTQSAKFNNAGAASKPAAGRGSLASAVRISNTQGSFDAFAPAAEDVASEAAGMSDADLQAAIDARLAALATEKRQPTPQPAKSPARPPAQSRVAQYDAWRERRATANGASLVRVG